MAKFRFSHVKTYPTIKFSFGYWSVLTNTVNIRLFFKHFQNDHFKEYLSVESIFKNHLFENNCPEDIHFEQNCPIVNYKEWSSSTAAQSPKYFLTRTLSSTFPNVQRCFKIRKHQFPWMLLKLFYNLKNHYTVIKTNRILWKWRLVNYAQVHMFTASLCLLFSDNFRILWCSAPLSQNARLGWKGLFCLFQKL